MGLDLRILPARGLVIVRYSGTLSMRERMEAFAAYLAHPDFAPGQKHLIDLTHVSGYEPDYVTLMQMQARKAAVFARQEAEVLMVYLAPGEDTLGLAQLVARSWEGLDGVTCLVQQDEARALELVGEKRTSLDALMAEAR